MIPILYDKNEIAFTSNGLGRLRDCITAIVTEERNGIYELDFEYPIGGQNYDLIQIGRIVGVTHEDSEDIQPFDIVSYSKPIDGVVSFHCVHISYRQSYMTVTASNINSLSDAFTALEGATPSNPFSYSTDKTSTGYVGCLDGVPRTVRQTLGGIEGSILDAYGGEYEFDKFDVILHSARGQQRDFSVRYGVNMLDYNEEYDNSNTYSSCIPYWTDGTETVVGDKQDSGAPTMTGRDECIPLDVSEKFESKPTKAQVNTMGLSVMNGNDSTIPAQNIKVSFVRLQDMAEFNNFANLLECKLCDTIRVIFPGADMSGYFKIVKTTWNVLKNRYDEMELGELSVTLAEALGIDSKPSDSLNTLVKPVLSSGLSPYSSRCTITSGGVYSLGKWRFVQLQLKIATSLSANNYYAILENADLPSTGSICALAAACAAKNYGNLSAYVNSSGRIVIITGGAALASNDIVVITGWYIAA